jgi:hypothetical protein
VYAPVLEAIGATPDDCSTQNNGSIYVDIDTTEEELEAAGAFVLSNSRTKNGWHIVIDEGEQFAQENHPSSNPANPDSNTGSSLTPEELAKREAKRARRERLEQIRLKQQMEAEQQDNED